MVLVVDQLSRRVMVRLGELNLTTEDLGKILGVSRPRISSLIHREELTVEAFERLTRALKVDRAWWEKPIARTFERPPDAAAAILARVRKMVP